NAGFPAATTFGNTITGPTSDAIFRAFADAVPKMVTAGWNRMIAMALTGHDQRKGRSFVDILFLSSKGGSGGTAGADGYDHIGLINCAGGLLAQDYEMFEVQNPALLLKHEYWIDSAGPGEWRGGLGTECEIRLDGERMMGVAFGDGVEEEARAFGLFGGGRGAKNQLSLHAPDSTVRTPKSKEILRNIEAGTLLCQKAGGGGGYGDPRRRSAAKVVAEVRDGFISVEAARRDYGVVVDPTTLTLDEGASMRLRNGPV
ncbi:MAG: hydantoinase B/oxoprolinase family protein, partial [Alphaproteobacteria bacterium]